jgi:MAC/Perforin domain
MMPRSISSPGANAMSRANNLLAAFLFCTSAIVTLDGCSSGGGAGENDGGPAGTRGAAGAGAAGAAGAGAAGAGAAGAGVAGAGAAGAGAAGAAGSGAAGSGAAGSGAAGAGAAGSGAAGAGAAGSGAAGAGAGGAAGSGTVAAPTLPGIEYLGRGYDVFGPYATPDGVKSAIFDLGPNTQTVVYNGMTYGMPAHVTETDLETAMFQSTVGASASEYLEQFANQASLSGSYSFFSGSLKTDFTMSQYLSTSVYFVQIENVIRKFDIQLPPAGSTSLTALLDPQFASDLASLDPDTLFATYGAYYLRDAIIGARADYNQTVNTATSVSESSLSVYAQAGYDSGIGNVTASDMNLNASSVSNYNSNASTNLVVIGGDAELGQEIFQSGDYDKWIGSIDANPVLTAFNTTSLVPIWNLLPDGQRKTDLQNAFDTFATSYAVSTVLGEQALVAITLQDNGANPAPFDGYTQINQDLNQGAGGDYIYLDYKTTPAAGMGPFLYQLTVYDGANPPASAGGFTFITDQDLNKGAGGDYLYLGYNTTSDPNQAIKAIAVVSGSSSSAANYGDYVPVTFYGNASTAADCNAGAGGSFIYIEVKY